MTKNQSQRKDRTFPSASDGHLPWRWLDSDFNNGSYIYSFIDLPLPFELLWLRTKHKISVRFAKRFYCCSRIKRPQATSIEFYHHYHLPWEVTSCLWQRFYTSRPVKTENPSIHLPCQWASEGKENYKKKGFTCSPYRRLGCIELMFVTVMQLLSLRSWDALS